ncbi:MAG: GNAT family N-acetyltransferase [Pseudomonadota bacterium]
MSSEVMIRPITHDDEAEWRRLWTGYLTFYNSSVGEDVYQTTFARLLSDDPNAPRGRLAVVGDKPVGLVHYFYHPHAWKIAPVCYLQDLFADPEVRGQGIGRKLIETVYHLAEEHGAANVYWTTQHFNETARQLYDRIATLTPFIKYQHDL